jgi:hypothetical protein
MKRHPFTILALGASLLSAGYLLGQAPSKTATPAPASAPAATAAAPQKLVKVATLNSVQSNREFQSNVQVLQAQRQVAIDLNTKMEQEKDAAKKKELKTQLDGVMAKLNENNQTMLKTYGFSLGRNYQMEVEVAHIYMFVTDEEAAQIEKAQKTQDKKDTKDTKKK